MEDFNKLIETYPKIFSGRCRYIECNNGWYNLLDSLCGVIQHYLNQKPKINQVIAEQIKEKYGTLRFYYSGGDDYIRGLVSMTEYLSGCTCEICGNPGEYINKNWPKVRCEKCLENEKIKKIL